MSITVGGLFQRELSEDGTIGGVTFKKGVRFDTLLVSTLYDPKRFEKPD